MKLWSPQAKGNRQEGEEVASYSPTFLHHWQGWEAVGRPPPLRPEPKPTCCWLPTDGGGVGDTFPIPIRIPIPRGWQAAQLPGCSGDRFLQVASDAYPFQVLALGGLWSWWGHRADLHCPPFQFTPPVEARSPDELLSPKTAKCWQPHDSYWFELRLRQRHGSGP